MTRRRRARGTAGPTPKPDVVPASGSTPDVAPALTPAPTLGLPLEPAPAITPEVAPTRALLRDAVEGWREVLRVSRPRSWLYTALPFLVAAFDAARGLTPAVIIGTLYFLGPYNLLLHGSDVDGTLSPERIRLTRVAIALTNLPFLVVLVLLGGSAAGVALLLAVGAALAYSTPPIRTRARPILGSLTSAMHLVLPAACGFLVAGRALGDLPWLALASFTAWAVATDLLGTIAPVGMDVRMAGGPSAAPPFGPRLTAVACLLLFALAAALAIGLGRPGALAALGLVLFLLPPAMVLLARRHDHVAVEAASRRAWADLLGLRGIVGLWLAVLLLRHWDLVGGFSGMEIAIAASAVTAGYAGWSIVATRLVTRRRRTHPEHERDILPLTIVVTSHDDGERLAVCLDALLDQTYADTSIVVIDMGSTDGSLELAAEILGSAGTVIAAPPRPEDWTERSWGRWSGVQATQGDLVLFVDVDTILVPVATRLLVEQLENGGWGLLSGVTRYDMPTVGERAAVPGFAMLLFGFRPIWLSALTGGRPPRVAFADGAMTLVRRDAYQASGGHAAVPDSVSEDIDLAQTLARSGRRVGTVHVADLAASRHFTGADAAVPAWRRTILASAGGSLALALLAIAVQVLAYLVPLVLPPLALISGAEPRTLVASCIPLFLLGFARFALVLTQRQPLTTVFWHPVTIGVALIGQLAGIVDHVTGRAPAWRPLAPQLAPVVASGDQT